MGNGNVDSDRHWTVSAESKEIRRTPARRLTDSKFLDETLDDQVLEDQGDRRTL
jgi:hypothetical protein